MSVSRPKMPGLPQARQLFWAVGRFFVKNTIQTVFPKMNTNTLKFSLPPQILKTAASVGLALVMLGFGLHFFQNEGVQVQQVRGAIQQADRRWLYLGIFLAIGYVWLHGEMYRQSFRAIGRRVGIGAMMQLYLKRNFVSVFLPAGFLSSQAFFSGEVARTERVREGEVLAASGVFSVAGLLSMVAVVVPALGWLLAQNLLPGGAAMAFLTMSAIFIGIVVAMVNFVRRGAAYFFYKKHLPALTARLEGLDWSGFDKRFFWNAILLSTVVELVGVLHVFVAAKTLGAADVTFAMSFAGYIAVLVVLMTAPFLRGVGAAEALLAAVLMRFGLEPVLAASVAVLFRFFEFWLVLGLAAFAFLFRPKNLALRLAPSVLLFALGVVNILSGLTPILTDRAKILTEYLPLEALHATAALTVAVGFLLLGTAVFLFRGLRSAWWLAIGLGAVSLVAHLVKGIDYEEASFALLTLAALLFQRKEYIGRTDFRRMKQFWMPALGVVATALLLGAIGFWGLDHRHFGAEFSVGQSIGYAFRSFLMLETPDLHPLTRFGHHFLFMMHLLGGLALFFLAWAVFQPFLPTFETEQTDRERAAELVKNYGNSPLDYFKTYPDKQFFFTKNQESFVAYKNTARYALALENPVAPDESALRESVVEFDLFCRKNGLRSIYYRIPEASADLYRSMGKKLLPLGQEAIVRLSEFNLEGKERKSLRNAMSKTEREGYQFGVHPAPLSGRLLQQLRAVSDEWLRMLDRFAPRAAGNRFRWIYGHDVTGGC